MDAAMNEQEAFCYNHPTRPTTLRCNRCGRPICAQCAVRTPVGYRCKTCVREQQKIFETAYWYDFPVAFLAAALVCGLGSILSSFIGFFILFVAYFAGILAARAVIWAVRHRRSRFLWIAAAAGGIAGCLPVMIPTLVLRLVCSRTGRRGRVGGPGHEFVVADRLHDRRRRLSDRKPERTPPRIESGEEEYPWVSILLVIGVIILVFGISLFLPARSARKHDQIRDGWPTAKGTVTSSEVTAQPPLQKMGKEIIQYDVVGEVPVPFRRTAAFRIRGFLSALPVRKRGRGPDRRALSGRRVRHRASQSGRRPRMLSGNRKNRQELQDEHRLHDRRRRGHRGWIARRGWDSPPRARKDRTLPCCGNSASGISRSSMS